MRHIVFRAIVMTAALISASSTLAQNAPSEHVKIKLLRDGHLLVDGERTEIAAVESRLAAERSSGVETPLLVFAEDGVDYLRVKEFLDMAKRYDRIKVGLVTGKAR